MRQLLSDAKDALLELAEPLLGLEGFIDYFYAAHRVVSGLF